MAPPALVSSRSPRGALDLIQQERPETASTVPGLLHSRACGVDGKQSARRNQKISNRPAAPLWIALSDPDLFEDGRRYPS